MKVSVQEKDGYKRVLTVEVEEDKIQAKFDEMLGTYKKEVSLPGFRPGKVPREMILSRFGKALKAEAIEALVSDSFKEACETEKLVPISKPVVSKLENKEGSPLQYEAEFEIEPVVAIEDYKNLGVKIEEKTVTDADIDTVLKDLQDRLSTLKAVERPLKKGDYADLEYRKVVIDGKEKKDFENPKYPVEIGNSTLKEFEEQLVGLSKGAEKTVDFTFPADYHMKEVAGKAASFTVAVREVRQKEAPALDDAFAKDVSQEVKTLADLKDQVRKDLAAENRRTAVEKASREALDKVIQKNPFDVPESRIKEYLALSFDSFRKQYPQSKTTPEEFNEKNRDIVILDFKKYKIIEVVSQKEGLKATQEETDQEIRGLAQYRGEDFDKLKAALRKSGRIMDIRENIKEKKVLNFLLGV